MPQRGRSPQERIGRPPKVTFYYAGDLTPELMDRARNAVDFLSGPPERLTLNALVARAIQTEVVRLERKHRGGKPFPKRPGELKRGARPR